MTARSDEAVCRITDLLEQVEAEDPRAVASMGGDRSLTYAELRATRDRYAKALLALGVRRGDRVAMATPPCVDFWIALHAVSSIGAISIGINPRYQSRDFEMLLTDASPALLIAVSPFEDRDYVAELAPLLPGTTPIVAIGAATAPAMSIDALLAHAGAVSDERLREAQQAVEPEDAAVIVYTSGATGRPKGESPPLRPDRGASIARCGS